MITNLSRGLTTLHSARCAPEMIDNDLRDECSVKHTLQPAPQLAVGRSLLERMTGQQQAPITRNPLVCRGRAVVQRTRIMVSVVSDCIASGITEAELIDEYPTLGVHGLRAAVTHGAELAHDECSAVVAR